jgi:branched-chain amino acid transport system permease protein
VQLAKFLQTLMDGVSVGSLYALIALGYTMVYGILKFINFAHSDVFVLGAWVSFVAAAVAGLIDQDAAAAGVQAAPVAGWVIWSLLGVLGAGALVAVYEYVIRPRLPEPVCDYCPPCRTAPTFALVGVWGFVAVGLAYLARAVVRMNPPGPGGEATGASIAAGGIILLLAMVTCGLVGFCIERLAYKPLRKAPRLNVLITAIGVSLFLQNVGQTRWLFGTRPDRMPTLLPDKALFVMGGGNGQPGVPVRVVDAMVIGTALVLMVLLDRLVFHSKMGRAMRAVSFSERNAALMGIDVNKVISFTFVLGAALAAAAGFLMGQKYPGLNQTAAAGWVLLGLKAFVAAVIGGIGNVRGAMLGGLLIGLLEFFGTAYISPELRDVYVFSVLILVLLFKPSGLLGKAVTEKV